MGTLAALFVATMVLGAAGCTSRSPVAPPPITILSPTPTVTSASPTATFTSTPTLSPSNASPASEAVPAGFVPMSVTFVSLQAGWVLGATCATCTVSMLRTRDGGKTWAGVPAPPAVATQGLPDVVRFANLSDGWVLASGLWATHDGGAHWAKAHLPPSAPGQVTDVEASAGFVHAVSLHTADTGGIEIDTAPVHEEVWKASPTRLPLGAGPIPEAHIVLQGAAGWILENDRVVITGARLLDGVWSIWQPPCTQTGGPALLAASSASDLVAVCNEGGFGGPPPGVRAYLSTDGGLTFAQASTAVPLRDLGAVASPALDAAVVAGADPLPGQAVRMVKTVDAGASWTTVYQGEPNHALTELGFTSASQGVAIDVFPTMTSATLLMTHDGGRTWAPVPFTPAPP